MFGFFTLILSQEELKLHHLPTPKLTKPAISVVTCVTALISLSPVEHKRLTFLS